MIAKSDESVQKRNNAVVKRTNSTTPRTVLDFNRQCKSRLGSKGRKSAATECSQERSSSAARHAFLRPRMSCGGGPLQKFVDTQRNVIRKKGEKQIKVIDRQEQSKSVLIAHGSDDKITSGEVLIGIDLVNTSMVHEATGGVEPLPQLQRP